jgi:hypothetical protein
MKKKNLKTALQLKKKVISNFTTMGQIGGSRNTGFTDGCSSPARCGDEAPSKHNMASMCVCL